MTLHDLVNGGRFRLLQRFRRTSPRHARRAATVIPVVSCLPGSDVWLLRAAIAFVAHFDQGGCVADRLHGRVVGNPDGRAFNFDHLHGGPLLWVPDLIPSGHLFVGHTVCPGFSKIVASVPWWQDARFCAPGYDYFGDGLDYTQVPVDMAPHAQARVDVGKLDAAAWIKPAQRAVLVYSDPIEQAAGYFNYCRTHPARNRNTVDGRRLKDWQYRDYLLQQALPSYAKLFISYQAMAKAMPRSVSLVAESRMLESPAETLAWLLSHLTGVSRDWPMIADAVALARQEHLIAIEKDLGRPLERSRRGNRQASKVPEDILQEQSDPALRREGLEFLASLGVDLRYFGHASGGVTKVPAVLVA